ncbi:hypothetical protein [Cerasibacillus terrae]|uniref:hypothetical protein n=1 Tax=Cerasibacillus terrae TaxID=2498845 RepID=UPI001746D17B|nr:hypothetical protein [Cerasibacillus terrae]
MQNSTYWGKLSASSPFRPNACKITLIKIIDKNQLYYNYSEIDDENVRDLIKGNNLLALHTLKEKYAGKVKMIYIDPPYNTDSSASTFLSI